VQTVALVQVKQYSEHFVHVPELVPSGAVVKYLASGQVATQVKPNL